MTDDAGPAPRPEEAAPDTPPTTRPTRLVLDGRRPHRLDDPEKVLQMVSGHVDLFLVSARDGRTDRARRHLFRVEQGEFVFGFSPRDPGPEEIRIVAVGGLDTEASVLPRTEIDGTAATARWIGHVARLVAGPYPGWDIREVGLDGGEDLAPGEQRRGPVRELVWLSLSSGSARLMGVGPSYGVDAPPVPLTSGLWLVAEQDGCSLEATAAAPDATALGAALDRFHACALARLRADLAQDSVRQDVRLSHHDEDAAAKRTEFFDGLAAIVAPRSGGGPASKEGDALFRACRLAAEAAGISVVAPAGSASAQLSGFGAVLEVVRHSRLRARATLLRGEWWRHDGGPLVGWLGSDREPVALLPGRRGRYVLVDPETGRSRPVDAAVAADLAPDAASLYPALPSRPLRLGDLLAFAALHARGSFGRLLLAVVMLGMSSWVMPLMTQAIVTSAIPRTELDQLAFCALALTVTAFAVAGVQVLEATAILRIEGLVDWRLQAAIMDRVLRLPASVFRDYTVGDFVDRALGIDAARRVFTGSTLRGILSGVFSWFSVALLFVYDATLAFVALALIAVRVGAIIAMSLMRLRHETHHKNLQGKVSGLVLQILGGIGKLRVASATIRALAVWSLLFAAQKRRFIAAQRWAYGLSVLDASFVSIATLVIFATAASSKSVLLGDLGAFLAFYVAFGQAMSAIGSLTAGLSEALTAVPYVTRILPLIGVGVEISEDRKSPGPISGAIELSRVTFRYGRDGPPILDNVSLRIAPGEYVAIVGPSGSGKSSLFRLILGFETVESGAVFYDGKAIDTLDLGALRRQLGVVLQNAHLMTGSIYDNICGGLPLELDQVWEAARLASLEADIRAMPMGLHTMISEGVSTISGGQRQRLMIARAIARRPRILLFDEATSSLDNQSQAVVSAALGNLNVTRLVIAHRLSTVQDADRIVVLAGGKIVETGSFVELSQKAGLFARFAQRQLV